MQRRLALVFIASSMIVAATAGAYILPAEAIFARAADRRAEAGFQTLVLEGHRGTPDHPKAETVWLAIRRGVGYRLEVKSGEQKTVTLVLGKKRFTSTDGRRATAERPKLDVVAEFLAKAEADPGGRRGAAFLSSLGVETHVVSLARLGKRVAYAMGAKPWESDKPQLWIDKELLSPVRVIEIDASKAKTDTRLLGYGSPQTGTYFPQRVEVWKNDQFVEVMTFDRLKVNEPVSEDLLKSTAE